MGFRIDISALAESDLDEAYAWIHSYSEEIAANWLSSFYASLGSLRKMRNRCAIAAETPAFMIEIRNLLFGEGSMQFRIIFGVSMDETSENGVVTIYRIRSSRQRPLSDSEMFGEIDNE